MNRCGTEKALERKPQKAPTEGDLGSQLQGFFGFLSYFYFLIGGKLLHNVLLVSVIQ